MTYEYELILTVRKKDEQPTHLFPKGRWEFVSTNRIVDTKLISLLAQFNIVIASIYKRIIDELRLEQTVIDDDIPF